MLPGTLHRQQHNMPGDWSFKWSSMHSCSYPSNIVRLSALICGYTFWKGPPPSVVYPMAECWTYLQGQVRLVDHGLRNKSPPSIQMLSKLFYHVDSPHDIRCMIWRMGYKHIAVVHTSSLNSAETSVSSPRKIIVFSILKTYHLEGSIQQMVYSNLKTKALVHNRTPSLCVVSYCILLRNSVEKRPFPKI